MILKCRNIYIDLTSVRAYSFSPMQVNAETEGFIASITFYIVPKPISVGIDVLDVKDAEKAQEVLEMVGEAIARLISVAKRKENGTHMEDLLKIVAEARARVAGGDRK